MEHEGLPPAVEARLGEGDFARLGALVERLCGIRMPPTKRPLLESRLRRRLRHLGLSTFAAYADLVAAGDPGEVAAMIDVVTTNKTDFFREPRHFQYLAEVVVPRWQRDATGPLRVWCAACATGEEAWTLAVVLAEVLPGGAFSILASDISSSALAVASAALYDEAGVAPMPVELRRKYLLRKVSDPHTIRVGPALRHTVTFQRLNLLELEGTTPGPFDVIFCRNVLIYFERARQREVLRRLLRRLAPGGHLFLGHAESIGGMDLPVVQVAPTVYRAEGR